MNYLKDYKKCIQCGYISKNIDENDLCVGCAVLQMRLRLLDSELEKYNKLNWFQKLFTERPYYY